MPENEGHLSTKRPPFADRTSLLRRLIAQDSRDELKRVLEMDGPERNTALPSSQHLRPEQGDNGVYALLKLAIAHDAVSCFGLLIRWADTDADADAAPRQEQQQQPNKPRFDLERVYRAARRAALRDGRLRCLLYLHDRDRKRHGGGGGGGGGVLGDPAELYATLLERARSPAAVVWLARRLLPASTVADYGEILAAQCADPYAQPAVVEMLVGLVVPPPAPGRRRGKVVEEEEDDDDDDDDDDKEEVIGDGCPALSPALCAAAGALRVSVIEVLLRYRPRAFAAVAELGVDAAAERGENPLLCALAHPLPGKPERPPVPIDSVAIDGGDEDETARAEEEDAASELGGVEEEDDEEAVVAELKKRWTTETRHVAAAMHVVVRRLVELARVELRAPECQQLLADLLDQAAMVYAFCLREFLLRNLPWLLAYHPMLRVSLLSPNKSSASTGARNAAGCREDDTLYTNEEIHGHPERREPDVEQEVSFTWVKGLDPKWARGALECCLMGSMQDLVKVWNLLFTPTTADAAEKYLGVRLKSLGGHDPVELLWALLLSEGEAASPLFSPQIRT
ncbi:hypothetical protein MYCTH_93534 [Thermothelomyces thermophilus ATCC 42464]|uniref:Uncharacterized protein n=1 Tax=Thermothelomyces thermophilus (strain ATCC 42464 / BCRC 31852 / DSM 1799) TaxID=573729 RepID=G2QDC2_THET4|nr:uncharacterized protein MYCTH_93534 [Thermothelomyces thermophilus ATCC 42464]AEO58287.1 hypothetical protein MYCTH_93534 [Thermothelomyces thermophilus ATCC 42464]